MKVVDTVEGECCSEHSRAENDKFGLWLGNLLSEIKQLILISTSIDRGRDGRAVSGLEDSKNISSETIFEEDVWLFVLRGL